MSVEFFYANAKQIKEILARNGIKKYKIIFHGDYPSIFADFGEPQEIAASRHVKLQQEILELAHSQEKSIKVNYISYDRAKELPDAQQPEEFDSFLGDGLIRSTIDGNKDLVVKILASGISVNFKEPKWGQTALHLALRTLMNLRANCTSQSANDVKFTLQKMEKIKEAIESLLSQSEINVNQTNNAGATAIAAAIEQLAVVTNSNRASNENTAQADKLIAGLLVKIQARGSTINIEKIEQKGYPMLAKFIREQSSTTLLLDDAKPKISSTRPASPSRMSPQVAFFALASLTVTDNKTTIPVDDALLEELRKQLEGLISSFAQTHHCNGTAILDKLPQVIDKIKMTIPNPNSSSSPQQ